MMTMPSTMHATPTHDADSRQHDEHKYEQQLDSDVSFSSDAFRIEFMKILPCSKRYCHDWTSCPFCHHGEKARRRDPKVTPYTGIACPDMKKDGVCVRGELCPYAHNVFEYWLHPTRYRTQLCNDGMQCKRRVCFFAHTASELRVPDSKPFVNPQALAAATAAAAARRSARASDTGNFCQTELSDRLAALQLLGTNGSARQTGHATMAQTAPSGNEHTNAQIVELLSKLLRQKQPNGVYPLKEDQSSDDQLAALYQSMGLMPSLGQQQLPHAEDSLAQLMAADPTGQLLLQLMANTDKLNSKPHQFVTPRSSLDFSGLQGTSYSYSDHTASGRSSFDTAHGRDLRRVSNDSSGLMTSIDSYASSNARMSLDGYMPQSTSYDCNGNDLFSNSQVPQVPTVEDTILGGTGQFFGSPTVQTGTCAAPVMSSNSRAYPVTSAAPLSGAAAAASAAAALNTPVMHGCPGRSVSFDAAPGSFVRPLAPLDTGRYSCDYTGTGATDVFAGSAPIGLDDLRNIAAMRSVSLPDGLSKSRFSALHKSINPHFTNLPAVTEGIPFMDQTGCGNSAWLENVAQNAFAPTAPTLPAGPLPSMTESPFSKAETLPRRGFMTGCGAINGASTLNGGLLDADSFFSNANVNSPNLTPPSAALPPAAAIELPQNNEPHDGSSS